MKITVAKNSGFCFGVQRAVETLQNSLHGKTCTLGEIIHNPLVVKHFEELGVKAVDRVEEVTDGTVVVRSHGAGKEVFGKLAEKGVRVVDATCIFVKKIHDIVERMHGAGYQIVIVGRAEHPEVIGINGWCGNSAVIIDSISDVRLLKPYQKLCVVAQTTYETEKFTQILQNILKDTAKTVEVFNTICYTTIERQREAEVLAKKSDAMFVVGGRNSSNTKRLTEICTKYCANVFQIEAPADIDYENLNKFNKIGIVAGASTPQGLIKEVILSMEEKNANLNQEQLVENQEITMADVMDSMENTKFKKGQRITATIANVTDDGLELSLPGIKADKLLSKDEINYEGAFNKDEYQIGDAIEVKVMSDNPITLSKKALIANELEEKQIAELVEDKKEFQMTFKESNKGGLIGKFGTYSVFVPASQIRLGYINDIDKYKDKPLRLEVTEYDRDKKKIVASQKVILEREKAAKDEERAKREEAFWNAIAEGQIVQGKVVRISSFGAFVSVNGFDCLAHKSDLSWSPVASCEEILEINKNYEFKVLKLDRETKKVSLGYKQLQPQPWDSANERYAAGNTITGKVARIVPFGAFIELEPGIDGLVHVSQVCHEWIDNPESKLKVGQDIEAKILEVDPENQKITLSMKALMPEPENTERSERPRREFNNVPGGNSERTFERKERPRREPRTDSARRDRSASPVGEEGGARGWTDSSSSGASIGDMLKALNMDLTEEDKTEE